MKSISIVIFRKTRLRSQPGIINYITKAVFNVILVFALFSVPAKCQIPVPLTDIISNSPYIFEGTVDSITYFQNQNPIYTACWVKISKVFKGDIHCGYAEVMTVGGTYDSTTLYVYGALGLLPGETGIFNCIPSFWPTLPAPSENPVPFSVYSEIQGFLLYDTDLILGPHDPSVYVSNYGADSNFVSHEAAWEFFENYIGHTYITCDAAEKLSYFPNPVHDILNIKVPDSATIKDIIIFDPTGRIVQRMGNLNSLVFQQINLSFLSSGQYICEVITNEKTYNLKIIKL